MANFTFTGLTVTQNEAVGRILNAALAAADPRKAVAKAVQLDGAQFTAAGQSFAWADFQRVRLVGVGKASVAMAQGLVDVLGDRITDGCLITKHLPEEAALPDRIQVLRGGHPVPTQESVESARQLEQFLQGSQADDLVFCLISGGGSALMTDPQPGMTLEDLQQMTRQLLACGASINEMNTLRKHLDQVKGGGLARQAYPACLVSLILSDVIGSPLEVIASGPTVADPSTFADAWQIIEKYHLAQKLPEGVAAALRAGMAGSAAETVKPGAETLRRVSHELIASNPQAAQAALRQAQQEGFHTLLLTTYLQGEASQAGGVMASILQQIDASGQPLARPACVIAGGETTVTLHGGGKGGRNQELALGAVLPLAGLPDVALITLATDGEDGPTDAAGALVTGATLSRAADAGLNPVEALQANDSYAFFTTLGDALKPGPTGTNVNDLLFLFAF